MSPNFKRDPFAALDRAMSGLRNTRLVDRVGAHEREAASVPPPAPMNAERIRGVRERTGLSLPAFARHLNTSTATVLGWEEGSQKPSGIALKLLAVVEKHGLEVLM